MIYTASLSLSELREKIASLGNKWRRLQVEIDEMFIYGINLQRIYMKPTCEGSTV